MAGTVIEKEVQLPCFCSLFVVSGHLLDIGPVLSCDFLVSIFFFIRAFISSLDLCLVIFCSSENEDRAHMAAALDQYRLGTVPHTASPKEIRQYLKTQFKACPQRQGRFRDQNLLWTSAGTVDKEK